MINKIKTIIVSKIYGKYAMKNEEWYIKRLKTCEGCIFNSKNKKDKTFKEKVLYFLNFFNPFCTLCGCEIKAKASEIREKCEINKWENI